MSNGKHTPVMAFTRSTTSSVVTLMTSSAPSARSSSTRFWLRTCVRRLADLSSRQTPARSPYVRLFSLALPSL